MANQTVSPILRAAIETQPSKTVLRFGEQQWSYAKLDQVKRLADELARKEELVAVVGKRTLRIGLAATRRLSRLARACKRVFGRRAA